MKSTYETQSLNDITPSLPRTSNFDRLMRLKEVLGVVSVGKSTWWAGVKSGRYPQPVRHLGPRITAWLESEIMSLIQRKEG